jgi:hypothetical protein
MLHVRYLEWPSKDERATGGWFDLAKNLQVKLIPSKLPSQDSRSNYDQEPIRDISNAWVSRLKALLQFPVSD